MSKSTSRNKNRVGRSRSDAVDHPQGVGDSGKERGAHPKTDASYSAADQTMRTDWSPRTRIIVSVLVVLHLAAVFSAPFAMPQPSSELSVGIDSVTGPYTSALYMRHGYRFFAPDPGPSHLLRYEVVDENGDVVAGRFPDKSIHKPRLMYHRFFMISEHFWGLGTLAEPIENQTQVDDLNRAVTYLRENGFIDQADWLLGSIPPSPNEESEERQMVEVIKGLENDGKFAAAKTARRNFDRDRDGLATAKRHRKIWLAGIAKYLKQKHNGAVVRIWIQEHLIPDYDHILDGGGLDDPETYGPRRLVYSDDEVVK